jgi:flagellar biosynthesis/type III secretory pathway M-ring protein FliF/YscJ
MDFQKQLAKIKNQIRDLYGKLTASQKITIGLLTVLVAGGVILLVTLARGEPWVKLIGTQDPKSVAAVKTLLEQNGINYRLATENGGSLDVPRDRLARARWLAFESGITSAKDSNMEWLWGEASFLETSNRNDQKVLESKKRTVEDAIRWSRSIRDVRIVIQQGPEPIYANRNSSSDSAAVAVALRPGLEGLSRSEASTIRALVSGAFNIPPANIKITDERRVYPYFEDAMAGLSEEDDLPRKKIQSTVEGLLSRYYRPSEFGVGVLVEVSPRRTELITTTYKPDGVATAEAKTLKESESSRSGAGDPVGVQPNVAPSGGLGTSATPVPAEFRTSEKKETHNENRFSSSQEKTEVPAGELKGLSVNVVLDRAAVRRVLQAEEMTRLGADRRAAEKVQSEADIVNFTVDGKLGKENLDQAVEAHRKAQADSFRELIPMSGAKVNVTAIMFPKPEMPVEVAASTRALGWASEHSGDLLVGGIALAGLWVVWRMFRQAIPPPLDVPPLDETVLEREAQAAEEEMARLAAQLSSAGPGGANGQRVEVVDEMVETANSVRELAKSNPEMASAVIRMWMADRAPKE